MLAFSDTKMDIQELKDALRNLRIGIMQLRQRKPITIDFDRGNRTINYIENYIRYLENRITAFKNALNNTNEPWWTLNNNEKIK
jgi:hypothetical protein